MDEEKIGVSNIPVSFLEPFPKNANLSGDELFLISQPIIGPDRDVSGYISKSIRYDTLANNVSVSLDIAGIEERIRKLCADFSVGETLNFLSDWNNNGNPYNVPTVLSALMENTRGQIVSVSGYILSDAISNILSNVTLPRLSATESPWVKTSQVTSKIGDSTTLVASQKLAYDIYTDLSDNYVHKTQVVSITGNSTTNVASQKLVSDISATIQSNFVKKTQIKTINGGSTTDVASQSLVNGLSNTVNAQYLPLTDVVDVLGTDTNKAASQSLVQDLSTHISQNFLREGAAGNFVQISDITSLTGDSTTKVASQSLVTNLFTNISSNVQEFYDQIQEMIPTGQDGQVYYLTPDGTVNKQTILNIDVYVCEGEEDIEASKNWTLNFKDVFATWDIGGLYKDKWFGYDSDYTGGSTPGYKSWDYDESKKSIVQKSNTTDYSFLISQLKTDRYRIGVRCYSPYEDDDFIGFIAAFAQDSSWKPHHISFYRTPYGRSWGTVYTDLDISWACKIDSTMPNSTGMIISCQGQKFLDQSKIPAWNSQGSGTLLSVIREGNRISAYTSKFKETESIDKDRTEFIVDFDNIEIGGENASEGPEFETYKNRLSCFRGPQRIGFSTQSQPYTYYEIKDFQIPKIIIDASKSSDNISSYYDGEIVNLSDVNAVQYVGVGRLTKNLATNKTFYVTNNGFTKFSEYTE